MQREAHWQVWLVMPHLGMRMPCLEALGLIAEVIELLLGMLLEVAVQDHVILGPLAGPVGKCNAASRCLLEALHWALGCPRYGLRPKPVLWPSLKHKQQDSASVWS